MKALLIGLVAAAILVVGGLRIFGRKLSRLLESHESHGCERHERKVTDIAGVSITSRRDREPFFFIFLAADGTIKRMGNGRVDDADRELFIGNGQHQLFDTTRSKITPEVLKLCGHFEHSEHLPYELNVRFKFKDSSDGSFSFCYGWEGPPESVRQFVVDTMRVTDQWYRDFKDRAQGQRQG